MKILNYLKYLLLTPIVLMVFLPINFFYDEFLNLDSEIYWEKHIATVKDLELIEYSGDVEDFPYDIFPLYKCKIEYAFDFNNKKYYGTSISSELKNEGDTINKAIYDKLYGSKKIYIYANSRNPNQLSLTKKNIISEKLFVVVGMLLLPFSILNLIRIRRKNRDKNLATKLEIYNDN